MRIQKDLIIEIALLAILVLFAGLLNFNTLVSAQIGTNTTVISKVNVTNSPPSILSIVNKNPITLNANSTVFVGCNVTVRDYNGYGDISVVNATLFDTANSTLYASDYNRTHYTNSSCSFITNTGLNTALYTCGFNVYYYANPGNWNCTAFVNDSYNVGDNKTNDTNISVLIAISTPDVINYGDLPVLSTSADIPANVTNVGNRNVNLTLYGYNSTVGDGLAMGCQQGNISYDNQHWSLSNVAWGSMNVLNNTAPEPVTGLTILQRNATGSESINTTHWKLYISPSGIPSGLCNGTIIFGGIQAN